MINTVCVCSQRPPLPQRPMERMKRFKRRLSLTLRGSQTIDESLSELAEQMTIEENSSKDSGECVRCTFHIVCCVYSRLYCMCRVTVSSPD